MNLFKNCATVSTVLMGLAALMLSACVSIETEEPSGYTYETAPVAIYNADWSVIPLPNNLLNPVHQATIPVEIPGVEPPTALPTTVDLPVVDAAGAEYAQKLGYPVQEDTDLTKALLAGQNKLDGFIPGIIARIPFSKKLDMTSVVPFDGNNADTANFFFFDVTDPENPEVVAPDTYYRIFNLEMLETPPYYLTVRMMGLSIEPRDYTPGHTYQVLMTGISDAGVKDVDGNPVMPDGYFSLFASPDTFIGPKGTPRNNIVTGLENVQTLEGARQITDWGLKIWEDVVGDARVRNEVVVSYHYSIATNPMPKYMNATKAISKNAKAFLPKPIDYPSYDDNWVPQMIMADAAVDSDISFDIGLALDTDTVTSDNLAVFAVSDAALTPVATSIVVENPEEDQDGTVTITPDADLQCGTTYLVALSNRVTGGPAHRPVVDESYFGLSRVNTPLVDENGWLSPHLDSRVDTLIMTGKILDFDAADLEQAGATVMQVLTLIEAMRQHNGSYIDRLVADEFVPASEDLALMFTFTTVACSN